MTPEQLKDFSNYFPNTPLSKLDDPWLQQFNVSVVIKRDDLIDSRISGNKFRKLKHALIRYQAGDYSGIVSFGGPWSNHLHATSAVTEKLAIPLVAIVRGEQPKSPSDTLNDIVESGANVQYVSRVLYREMRHFAEQGKLEQHPFIEPWSDYMIIPEGGCSEDALAGVAEIISEDDESFDAIYLACGTGATLAGVSVGLGDNPSTKLVGIAALKGGNSLQENVQRLLQGQAQPYTNNWMIDKNFHFGGFAKTSPELIDFMNQLYKRTGLVTEPVYTGKTLFALYQHIEQGQFQPASKIMMIHTGGLQGLRGFKDKGLFACEASLPYDS
ncbi:MAG: 1-aminocyclopropane-1-carboxylate deaminase/D-cysteine desulfhydrase [Gammaproteobacteria bacterium]|nr:MAG: 1-aminocyclopropane-1-carboxylate deaminase/D-cysteine desulfhydrase [Gammaproteobacteria bacterium]